MGLPRSTYYDAPPVKTDDAEIVPATTILPNVFATLDAAATVGVGTVLPVGMRLFSVSVVGGALYTASTRPSLPNGTEGQIWAVAPMLPAGDLSWSLQFVSGADLAAADTQALRPEAVLGGGGNTVLSDPHYGGGLSYNLPSFSVIRTGTGDLSFLAGGNFNMNSLYGIYTAGTQTAATSAYELPRGQALDGSGTILGSGNSGYEAAIQNYQAYYPDHGGNVLISAQGDVTGAITAARVDSDYIGNWLWRQGGSIAGEQTAWWINFGTYTLSTSANTYIVSAPVLTGFTGIGALGGGNVTIDAGGNAGTTATNPSSGLAVAVGATGRVLADGSLLETGGGDLTVKIGGRLNSYNAFNIDDINGTFVDVRGNISISAGQIGNVGAQYGSNLAADFRTPNPLTAENSNPTGGIVVAPGDGTVTIDTRGDLVLGGVANPGLVSAQDLTPFTAALNGTVTNFAGGGYSWFSLWTNSTAMNLFSAGGNLTPSMQGIVINSVAASGGNDAAVGTVGNYMYPATLCDRGVRQHL